jgi:hypothetical protein
MSLTYVYLASAPGAIAATAAGKSYTANAQGVITAVVPLDALSLQGINGVTLRLLTATGATTDRPAPQPATALTGALNNVNPAPGLGERFYDTTLSKTIYYVGTGLSSTGWVDYNGAVV